MIDTLNAEIVSTSIEIYNGILTAWVNLRFGQNHQGFGGRMLYNPELGAHSSNEAGPFIIGVMKAVGVDRWESLKGKIVRIKADRSRVYSIGHAVDNKWYTPGGSDES